MNDKIKSDIISMEEERANSIAFSFGMIFVIAAFIVVVGFLDGSKRDYAALLVTVVCMLIRFMEKKVGWFKRYAKYAYMTIPFWCTCVLIISNDGKYAAVTQVYFMYLTLSIAYYDVKMVLICSAVTIISTVWALIFFTESMLKLDNLTIWFYIFTVYLMATFLSAIIARRMRHLIEKTRLMKAYEDELIYLEQLEKKEEKHSEFIHNINHYFNAIGELARVEHCEQIVSLVEELNGKLLQNERIIYSNHKVLNAVLSEKASVASEHQILFEVYVEPGIQLTHIADGDLVAMLGNLLDNALEAAKQCKEEKRKISLWIYMEKEGKVCVVKLINYYVQQPILHKYGFVSTKKACGVHGIGIRSVENTAEKYNGYLQCAYENEKFQTILILSTK